MEVRGFEPLTPALQTRCSANWATPPDKQFLTSSLAKFESWLRGRDLNPRPLGYEPNELPDCSTPRHTNCDLRFDTWNLKAWWAWVDSNYRPHAYQACALTNWATGPYLICGYFCRKKEPHITSVRSVCTVDTTEGRVASVAVKDLPAIYLDFLVMKELVRTLFGSRQNEIRLKSIFKN